MKPGLIYYKLSCSDGNISTGNPTCQRLLVLMGEGETPLNLLTRFDQHFQQHSKSQTAWPQRFEVSIKSTQEGIHTITCRVYVVPSQNQPNARYDLTHTFIFLKWMILSWYFTLPFCLQWYPRFAKITLEGYAPWSYQFFPWTCAIYSDRFPPVGHPKGSEK